MRVVITAPWRRSVRIEPASARLSSAAACDMLPAWALLDGHARASFRGEVDVDDATWQRGRGRALALALGVGAVDVYRKSNPVLAAMGRRSIAEVLTER